MADKTPVAQSLETSRTAHVQGRKNARQKQFAAAREHFAVALKERLAARGDDPGYTDPAWAGDLTSLHSRKELEEFLSVRLVKAKDAPDPEGYDAKSVRRVNPERLLDELRQADEALVAYFRQQLGIDANTHSQVDLTNMAAAVIPPDRWRTVVEGETVCATCTHPKASHPAACVESFFDVGAIQRCPCAAYAPLTCRHTWVNDATDRRRCAGCGEQQQLFPIVAVEDTEAFKQLQREAKQVI